MTLGRRPRDYAFRGRYPPVFSASERFGVYSDWPDGMAMVWQRRDQVMDALEAMVGEVGGGIVDAARFQEQWDEAREF